MPRDRRLRPFHKAVLIGTLLVLASVECYLVATWIFEQPPEDALDAQTFHDLLHRPEDAAGVERIQIEPRGHGDARYVVWFKADARRRRVVYAEFPGTITRQIFEARIAYSVKARPSALDRIAYSVKAKLSALEPSKQRELDATTFQVMLAEGDEISRIERIRAELLGDDHARYVVKLKGASVVLVYAEFPGTIIQQIRNAKIPYSVKAKDD